jgi:hypothetical protein
MEEGEHSVSRLPWGSVEGQKVKLAYAHPLRGRFVASAGRRERKGWGTHILGWS